MEEFMKEKKEYAIQWDESAKYFYENGYYSWMSQKLADYNTIVELGCGTGYSTLALIENGFNVIAIDKNASCLEKAKELLSSKGVLDSQVVFIEGDITDEYFRKSLITLHSFDVVVCWNIGSYWSKEMMQYYVPHMIEYGLNVQQIKENPESSYSELIVWSACGLAKAKGVPFHIVERTLEIINKSNDTYYCTLKDEIGYSEIIYDNLNADSISQGGRILSIRGIANKTKKLNIVFVSVFMQ